MCHFKVFGSGALLNFWCFIQSEIFSMFKIVVELLQGKDPSTMVKKCEKVSTMLVEVDDLGSMVRWNFRIYSKKIVLWFRLQKAILIFN